LFGPDPAKRRPRREASASAPGLRGRAGGAGTIDLATRPTRIRPGACAL
jgi:hypothetical protein